MVQSAAAVVATQRREPRRSFTPRFTDRARRQRPTELRSWDAWPLPGAARQPV